MNFYLIRAIPGKRVSMRRLLRSQGCGRGRSVAGPFCGGQRLVSALGALLLSLQVDPCVRNPQERRQGIGVVLVLCSF